MWEWNDAVSGSSRGRRGGSWGSNDGLLQSSFRTYVGPTFENHFVGFRVASVPEPSTAVLVLMGVGALYLWKRRRATL